MAVVLFGLFIVIALTGGTVFSLLTIALPKIVDEGMAGHISLSMVGSIATAVLICGALAQLCVGRVVEYIAPHLLFAVVAVMGAVANLWAAYADGFALMAALAVAVAATYGQITVNDMVMARYTADAWRGRVYAVRYFLLFVSAGAAIGMISLLHNSGGFGLVLGANAAIAVLMVFAIFGLVAVIQSVENRQPSAQPAE
jgi:MFS family permease